MSELERTESILGLISSIEDANIQLPDFQRDFVWDISKSLDLFDSLFRDIFIGSLIYGKPSFGIAVRPIDDRPRKSLGKRRASIVSTFINDDDIKSKCNIDGFRIILDGQQRITSLYRALKGIDDLYFIVKNEKSNGNEIDYSKANLEDIIECISCEEYDDHLSISIHKVYLYATRQIKLENEKRDHLSQTPFINSNDFNQDEVDLIFSQYLDISDKIESIFKESKLLSYYLLDMNNEKFTLFFERSNSRGMQLSFIDILVAKLYTNFKLRDAISDYKSNHSKYDLNVEVIVRAIALFNSNYQELDRKYILEKLDADHFKKYWDATCLYYNKSIDFLYDKNFIISQNWMPYPNMVLPLMVFLANIKGHSFNEISDDQFDFISYWYWGSVLSQRYSAAANESIVKDSNIMHNIASGNKILDKFYLKKIGRINIQSNDDLYSFSKKSSAIYKGILNFIGFCSEPGLLNFKSTSKIQFNDESIDDHHIFPSHYLKIKYSNNFEIIELADSVVNRTLIPKITNIQIGAKSPQKYLTELRDECNSNITKSLESHFIPKYLIDEDHIENYLNFLKDRSILIFSHIKEKIIDKVTDMEQKHYEEHKIVESQLDIYAQYKGVKLTAKFDTKSNKVIFNNTIESPTKAAKIAKSTISNKEVPNQNGWTFWRFRDYNGEDKFIINLKK